MKKIISISAIVIALALLFVSFTACNGNKEEVTTTEAPAYTNSASIQDVEYTAEVNETTIVISSNGEVYQTLILPDNSGIPFDYEYAKEHFEFLDMNFDGNADFYIAANKNGDVIQYHCWLYNATTKEFDYSTMLSTLTNISIDAENHNVLSRVSSNGGDKIICYKWVDGSLRVDSQYTVGDDSIPEEVTQAALNNVIGQNQTASNSKPVTQKETDKAEPEKETTTKKDKDNGTNTTTKKPDKNQDETKKPTSANNDKETEAPSTTKENKPLYTTTTAPYDGGVLIETDVDIDEGWF